eukprot:3671154-Prorocentrum_lima.AAC.1
MVDITQRRHVIGNALADKYAKKGAQQHPFTEATAQSLQQAKSIVVTVARYIGDLTWAFHQHYGQLLGRLAKELEAQPRD